MLKYLALVLTATSLLGATAAFGDAGGTASIKDVFKTGIIESRAKLVTGAPAAVQFDAPGPTWRFVVTTVCVGQLECTVDVDGNRILGAVTSGSPDERCVTYTPGFALSAGTKQFTCDRNGGGSCTCRITGIWSKR
jgi:hypothetical protein